MYKAGHLIRRSSVRLKSLSGGHSDLQMIISQMRDVRSTFKAFVCAQSTLSEDLLKWSSTIENDVIQSSFINLSELNSLWTEVQNDFVDSLKQLRYNFNLILEGERHVAQAKQIFSAKEEAERSLRRELQKSYNKGTSEEIHLLRDKLNRIEKTKEIAHMDVVERTKENEAVRMIRIKDGMGKIGSAYARMTDKASIIFNAQVKVAAEIPDVHDRAIECVKYKGFSSSTHIEEAKDQLRHYSLSPSRPPSNAYHEPPPPYSPSKEKLNELSRDFSGASLDEPGDFANGSNHCPGSFHSPTAPNNQFSKESFNSTFSPSSISSVYPSLDSSEGARSLSDSRPNGVYRRMRSLDANTANGTPSNALGNTSTKPESKPKKSFRLRVSKRRVSTPESALSTPSNTSTPLSTPITPPSSVTDSAQDTPDDTRSVASVPPPYNPYYS